MCRNMLQRVCHVPLPVCSLSTWKTPNILLPVHVLCAHHWCTLVVWQLLRLKSIIFIDHIIEAGNAIGSADPSICPFIYPSASTLTELSELWPWPFACAWVMTIVHLGLKVKVRDKGLRSECSQWDLMRGQFWHKIAVVTYMDFTGCSTCAAVWEVSWCIWWWCSCCSGHA